MSIRVLFACILVGSVCKIRSYFGTICLFVIFDNDYFTDRHIMSIGYISLLLTTMFTCVLSQGWNQGGWNNGGWNQGGWNQGGGGGYYGPQQGSWNWQPSQPWGYGPGNQWGYGQGWSHSNGWNYGANNQSPGLLALLIG